MRRGNPDSAFDGRPQIAIVNTASDLAPCNTHLDEIAQSVKNGIWEAGGVPLNLPMISLGETQVRPTAMLWRNMAAMATEEMMRANPIDGAVLLGGCDKTIPALLMGASSVDLPSIVVPGGPMLTGTFRGSPTWLRNRCMANERGSSRRIIKQSQILRFRVSNDSLSRSLQHNGYRINNGNHG
jgi:dihydroxyacid dehydratase/phosphogluconate dehydratase